MLSALLYPLFLSRLIFSVICSDHWHSQYGYDQNYYDSFDEYLQGIAGDTTQGFVGSNIGLELSNGSFITGDKTMNLYMISPSKNFAEAPMGFDTEINTGQEISNIVDDRQKINQCENIIGASGCGTYGIVWIVKRADSKVVARKQVSLASAVEFGLLNDIKMEISASMRLSDHPSFPTFYEWYFDDMNVYFDLELITGGTLLDFINKFAPLSDPIICHISAQILCGIAYMERHKLVHCDLRSKNIMLTSDRRVKIIDLGFMVRHGQRCSIGPDERLGSFAPESKHLPMTSKADIWSLGVIMFYMASKRFPFAPADIDSLNLLTEYLPAFHFALNRCILTILTRNVAARPNVEQLKNHRFFSSILNWDSIASQPISFAQEPNADAMNSHLTSPRELLSDDVINDFEVSMAEQAAKCSPRALKNGRNSLHNWANSGHPDDF